MATANDTFVTYLHSLGIQGLEIVRPIPVTVRRDEEEFIASWFDAGISSGGYTAQEAVSSLQSLVADLFVIDERDNRPLSPAMTSQRNVLREFICRQSLKS
jgi:hypothetical protein